MPDAAVLRVASSLSGRCWVWQNIEDRLGLGIAQRLEVPEIIGRLLAIRGVGIDQANDFLAPSLRAALPDPSCLRDMDIAATRLAGAVQAQETVAVFGDYDVDGACSAALMASVLAELGCATLPYIPDRIREGYGPNIAALQALVARGATLIICVDCGTAAAAALASVAGTDVVVLDHHKSEGAPPPILALVNPNRPDDNSGLGATCATGIAFLALVALMRALRRAGFFATRREPDLLNQLDLVALATICDVMPLVGLNRAFVAQGLRVMGRRARVGIAALLEVARIADAPTAHSCGFALGPRINAGGRIGEADLGLRLLLNPDPASARLQAETLDGVNRQRQLVEADILDAAMAQAGAQHAAGAPVLLASGAGWHPGVVGIIAGRIKERFNRPALAGGIAEGLVRGSGRSVAGLDLGSAVIAAREAGLLTSGGGHAMAAGFSLDATRLEEFHAFLIGRLALATQLPAAPDLPIDGTLALGGATLDLAGAIGRLAPFGHGQDEPVFVLPRLHVLRHDLVGRDGNMVRAMLGDEAGGRLKAMLFNTRTPALRTALTESQGAPLHVAGHLRAESWNGATQLGFVVVDLAAV